MSLTEATPLTLSCSAAGYPPPNITWYQEGVTSPLHRLDDLFNVRTRAERLDDYVIKTTSVLEFRGQYIGHTGQWEFRGQYISHTGQRE